MQTQLGINSQQTKAVMNVLKRLKQIQRRRAKTAHNRSTIICSYGSEKASVNMCEPEQKVQQNEEERKKRKNRA